MNKKILCCLLALMLSVSFSSCAQGETEEAPDQTPTAAENTGAEEPEMIENKTETELQPDVIGTDFEGKTVRYLAAQWFTQLHVFAEELTGDSLNDAAYERQELVKESLDEQDIRWNCQ